MTILERIPQGKQLILFDGVCNFCDDTMKKIIKADKKNAFVFASIQSEIGKEIISYIGINNTIDSIILYQPGYAYFLESDAVFEISKQLSGFYPLIQLGKIFPKPLRNKLYQIFAKNRYNWFGKKQECELPSPEIRSKFLS